MCDKYQPINSPHPDLRINEREDLVAPYPPAEKPTLLYRGQMLGRWRDAQAVRSYIEGFSPVLPPDEVDCLADELMTGVSGLGEVGFALWPEPHITWLFKSVSWPLQLSWPEMVPPVAHSPGLAVNAGPGGISELPHVALPVGRSRVMFPAFLSDPDELIDEARFYLVKVLDLSS